MAFAPAADVIDLTRDAAVDASVNLDEYANAWRYALMSKPIHYEDVEIGNYFIDFDDLHALNALYETRDPSYGTRK